MVSRNYIYIQELYLCRVYNSLIVYRMYVNLTSSKSLITSNIIRIQSFFKDFYQTFWCQGFRKLKHFSYQCLQVFLLPVPASFYGVLKQDYPVPVIAGKQLFHYHMKFLSAISRIEFILSLNDLLWNIQINGLQLNCEVIKHCIIACYFWMPT